MIRRILLGGVAILLLVSMVGPASAQTSGAPIVTLSHKYAINEFGFGILNDTFTFQNNGTSTVQIPSFQMGVPDAVASHAAGFVLVPESGYTESQTDSGNLTTITVTPSSPTLAAGSSRSVSVETYLSNVLNITAGSTKPFGALLLLSPSVNMKVNTLNLVVDLPDGGSLTPAPASFIPLLSATPPSYTLTETNVTPTVSTQWSKLTDSDQAFFLPIQVASVVSTIIPGNNAYPQVQDTITLRNLASYTISDLPLTLLSSAISTVTIVPFSTPPTIDPTAVTLLSGSLALTSAPFSAAIQAGDNFTFAMVYSVPGSMVKTSGDTVSVSLPYTLPLDAVVGTYKVTSQLPSGMHPVGASETVMNDASPIGQGVVTVGYTVSTGWGADQAIPAASLVFAASFIVIALRRPEEVETEEAEEEEQTVTGMLPDLIKGLEDKVALFGQFQTEVAGKSQGGMSRADIDKVRNEIDSLKTRAINRLNEIRQTGGSKHFVELLSQIQDAEREEDRSAKDLLNLYDQYHSRRMREETFRRLLPNYRKRWDASTNRLSDLLNLAQREGKQV